MILAIYWPLRKVRMPIMGHFEGIQLVKRNKTHYVGKYNVKDFEGKSALLFIGYTPLEIEELMSGQNNVPVLFDFVCIFMVPKEIEMPKLRTSRKDAFIDDSLNSLQLTRNYYIEYNLYDGQMPGNKMILVVDNSGKFTGGYEFIPSNDCTGKPYCRVVGWNANHRFTCEDYCLESNIDFIKQHKYDK